MVKYNELEKGRYYRVEFGVNSNLKNIYTVEAVDKHFVLVLTKNGKKAGGNGMVQTATDIREITKEYAVTGLENPANNEAAIGLLIKEGQ